MGFVIQTIKIIGYFVPFFVILVDVLKTMIYLHRQLINSYQPRTGFRHVLILGSRSPILVVVDIEKVGYQSRLLEYGFRHSRGKSQTHKNLAWFLPKLNAYEI